MLTVKRLLAVSLVFMASVASADGVHIGGYLSKISVSGVNGKTQAATLIGTTENQGRRFYPLFIMVEVTAANTIAVAATASVGTNASSYNNVLTASALTGLTSANASLAFVPTLTAIASVSPGTGIFLNVTTGATATTCTLKASVLGYYE